MKKYDPHCEHHRHCRFHRFGPVTSRRGGQSSGINLLPPSKKFCSFDCAYCMLSGTQTHSGKEAGAWASIDLVEEGLIEASEFLRKIKSYEVYALWGMNPPMPIAVLATWSG